MKISTSWSQLDWDKALTKVWKLSRDFEEILNFGLEHGFITSSDIIHASDIYKDPNKEYDDDEVKEIIHSRGISDIMSILKEEYSIDEILGEFSQNEILENMDNDNLLEYLEGTYELEKHDEDVKNQTYHEYVDEWIDQLSEDEKNKIDNISNLSPDDLHCLICDIVGVGYYDKKGLMKGLKNIVEKLNKNCYGVDYR